MKVNRGISTYIKRLHVPVAPFSRTHESGSIISRDRVDEVSTAVRSQSERVAIIRIVNAILD